jgi:hypothetical protein
MKQLWGQCRLHTTVATVPTNCRKGSYCSVACNRLTLPVRSVGTGVLQSVAQCLEPRCIMIGTRKIRRAAYAGRRPPVTPFKLDKMVLVFPVQRGYKGDSG